MRTNSTHFLLFALLTLAGCGDSAQVEPSKNSADDSGAVTVANERTDENLNDLPQSVEDSEEHKIDVKFFGDKKLSPEELDEVVALAKQGGLLEVERVEIRRYGSHPPSVVIEASSPLVMNEDSVSFASVLIRKRGWLHSGQVPGSIEESKEFWIERGVVEHNPMVFELSGQEVWAYVADNVPMKGIELIFDAMNEGRIEYERKYQNEDFLELLNNIKTEESAFPVTINISFYEEWGVFIFDFSSTNWQVDLQLINGRVKINGIGF